MKKFQVFLVILVSLLTFFFVYAIHFDYPYPYHVDEWHHITEAKKIENREYTGGSVGFRVGFHLFLYVLSKLFNLVSIYQFLPAIWAVFSGLVLFFVLYKKTQRFSISIFAMLFFATIKSNVNITGLWFFTSLTFSIPFIFLYFYFFTEGLEKKNKKFILISLAIMLFLISAHSISVLFALPILLIYSLMHTSYIKNNYKFFLSFLLIPILGMLLYKSMAGIPLEQVFASLFDALQFRKGWGILELNNSFLELYSLTGYILAILGAILIIAREREPKKYLIFVLWPLVLLISMSIFKLTDVSYLSPYQRNLYYFAISLPILSAFGLYHALQLIRKSLDKIISRRKLRKYLKAATTIIIILAVAVLAFRSYYYTPEQISLYQVIQKTDIPALEFIKTLPVSTVIAPIDISTALYPLTGHKPIATIAFYGSRDDVESFFGDLGCREKEDTIKKYSASFILSREKIDCGWELIYGQDNYVYKAPDS